MSELDRVAIGRLGLLWPAANRHMTAVTRGSLPAYVFVSVQA